MSTQSAWKKTSASKESHLLLGTDSGEVKTLISKAEDRNSVMVSLFLLSQLADLHLIIQSCEY